MTLDPIVTMSARLAIACLFAQASWHKLSAPAAFRATLAGYGLLPQRALIPTICVLCGLELGVVCGVLAGQPIAALTGALLLGLYAAAMMLHLVRNRAAIECGCGGPPQPVSLFLVARNLVLVLIALIAAAPTRTRELTLSDGAAIAGILVLFAAVYAMGNAAQAARARFEEWD